MRVQLAEEARQSKEDLDNILIVTPTGKQIPLRAVADEQRQSFMCLGKFLALGGAVAVVHLLLTSLAIAFVDVPDPRLVIEGQAFCGFLIGIGLGIGFAIAEPMETKLHQLRPAS